MIKLTTVEEIKEAVDKGLKVYEGNDAYQVLKDKNGFYRIEYAHNGYCIGLTWADGKTLNGTDFYIKQDDNPNAKLDKIESAKQVLKEAGYLVDHLWQVQDILDRAKDIDVELTEEQAKDVAYDLEQNHDCNQGINWEVIDIYINEIV